MSSPSAPLPAWQAEVVQLVLQQPGLAASCGDLLDARNQVVDQALMGGGAGAGSTFGAGVSPLGYVLASFRRCDELARGAVPYSLQAALRRAGASEAGELRRACDGSTLRRARFQPICPSARSERPSSRCASSRLH